MNPDEVSRINGESLPKIRAVARDGAVRGAIGSLAVWGAINVGTWFLLGGENRKFLSGLPNPSDGIYVLLYGGLILGAAMLAFAAFGLVTRFSGTIFLDGLSLIGVGLWNVTSDFIAISTLRPYGYTIEKPSTLWIMLGVCQLVWGARQFSAFARMAGWSIPYITRSDLADFRKTLQGFVQLAEDPQQGLVKAFITVKGPLGLDIMSRTTQYSGILSSNTVIMVSSSLDDCFLITREAMNSGTFGSGGVLQVQVEQGYKVLSVTPLSVFVLKAWSGKPVQAVDIQFAAEQKALTMPILQRYLASEDPDLRTASVVALPTVSDEAAARLACMYIDDPSPAVQAAALQACAQLKVTTAGARAIDLLQHPDEHVRISAVKCLSAIPQPSAASALEKAMSFEETAAVKKELKRAIRAQNRQLAIATC